MNRPQGQLPATPQVLLLLGPLRSEAQIVQFLAHPSSGVRLVRRCLDLADLLAHAQTHEPDLVVISDAAAGCDAAVVDELRRYARAVVGVADGPRSAERLRRLRLSAIAEIPPGGDSPATGLMEAFESALTGAASSSALAPAPGQAQPPLATPALEGGRGRGRIVTVWGGPGSPGRSTAAAALAIAAAAQGHRVVLVDADVDAPSQAFAWPTRSGHAVSGLVRACRRADENRLTVEGAISCAERPVDQEFELMTGIAGHEERVEVRPDTVVDVVTALAEAGDLVIVDIGSEIRPPGSGRELGWSPHRSGVGRACLRASDSILCAVRATPLGVLRFAQAWPALAELQLVSPMSEDITLVATGVGSPGTGRKAHRQFDSVVAAVAPGTAWIGIEHEPPERVWRRTADRLAPWWAQRAPQSRLSAGSGGGESAA